MTRRLVTSRARGGRWRRLVPLLSVLAAAEGAAASSFRSSSPPTGFVDAVRSWASRRLSSTLIDVPTDDSFVWNGTSSDLAQQFYRLHESGETADKYDYTTSDVPALVQQRLAALELEFQDLPGLLQRALIWDTGYTFNENNEFTRVYTEDGVSMAEIAVSVEEYASAGCLTTNCTDPSGVPTLRSKTCSGSMMLSVSHCASQIVTPHDGHTSMWATGGDPNAVPEMNMIRHEWDDQVYNNNHYIVYAIHTISNDVEPAWNTCMASGQYSSIIIPCYGYSADTAKAYGWKAPAYGALTNAWLARYKQESASVFHLLYLLPILAGTAIIAAGVFAYFRWQRRQSMSKDVFNLSSTPRTPPQDRDGLPETHMKRTCRAAASSDLYQQQAGSGIIYGSNSSSSASIMRALTADPLLRERRVPMDSLVLEREVAKGAFGEVWLCSLDGRVVAVKRLLRTRKHTFDDIQAFMDEIQLTASLDHPNVLTFIGVAWNTLENLSMVMEYLPNGDLQTYLRKHRDASPPLTWATDKCSLALGIARALAYMHSRQPKLIHRDVKAKNVLLTLEYDAKLIDFGVSRPYGDNCMTVGVGTPFWTAPEVLDGSVYSEMSDIYSFGVVMAELDTCAAPYDDARGLGPRKPDRQSSTATTTSHTSTGTVLQPFHILKLVMAGCLKPNFSASCPPAVREIAEQCLRRDPDTRPSAQSVVRMLEALDEDQLREAVPEQKVEAKHSGSSSDDQDSEDYARGSDSSVEA